MREQRRIDKRRLKALLCHHTVEDERSLDNKMDELMAFDFCECHVFDSGRYLYTTVTTVMVQAHMNKCE